MTADFERSIRAHRGLFLAEGIVLTILGLAAMVVPSVAGLASTIFLGWLFLMAGIVGLIATLKARGAPGFGWSLLSALIALVAGGVLLWNPLQGLITVTYVLVVFFIVDGILIIVLAAAYRRELAGKWEWMAANGVIDLILAAIVIAGFPGMLLWTLGLLVGVDMLFGGASLIAIALDASKPASS